MLNASAGNEESMLQIFFVDVNTLIVIQYDLPATGDFGVLVLLIIKFTPNLIVYLFYHACKFRAKLLNYF